MNYQEICEQWLSSPVLSKAERNRVAELKENAEQCELYFSEPMTFGTAGLRSVMEMGPGCMNRFTVAHITQAIASLVKSDAGEEQGVVIAYDSRHKSRAFAETAAAVMAANGIKVYLFDDIRPTPELSFAILQLGCKAGINITASHNPKEYNGYKAYWQDGAQISPAQAQTVSKTAEKIDILTGALICDFFAAVRDKKIIMLGEAFDRTYLDALVKTAVNPQAINEVADSLKIVYTPLHGAGRKLVPAIMRRIGLKHIYTVAEQMKADGAFPTVKKPNPEYADVFTGGIAIADRVGSDLVIATDPDADRIGVMCRGSDGNFFTVTGNQMGALTLDYIIRSRRENKTLTENDYAVKSFVSTDLANRICEVNGAKLYEVPTGFKYIGEVIYDYEKENRKGNFLMGFEESYGYLFGTYARDKDAVGAAMIICEMTAWYAAQGMTLGGALEKLYETYGFYGEGMVDQYMEGLGGIEQRKRVMKNLRDNTPTSFAGYAVVSASDFALGETVRLSDGEKNEAPLKNIDVLSYTLENGDKVIVRPSGTEPKIKIYFLCHSESRETLNEKLNAYRTTAESLCIK